MEEWKGLREGERGRRERGKGGVGGRAGETEMEMKKRMLMKM